MRRLLPPLAAGLVLVALALAVLAQRGGPGATARVRDGRVAVVLSDFRIVPQSIRAPAGKVTFVLRNRGRLAHGFRLRKAGIDRLVQPSLAPGARAEATAELPKGDYRMYDALSNFEDLGMYGTVRVR